MFKRLLNETCDIYHLKVKPSTGNYGAPVEDEYYFSDDPDITGVPTKFFLRSNSYVTVAPGIDIEENYLAYFLGDTSVKYGDKIVWNGVSYQARTPHKPNGHHIEVLVVRMNGQK